MVVVANKWVAIIVIDEGVIIGTIVLDGKFQNDQLS